MFQRYNAVLVFFDRPLHRTDFYAHFAGDASNPAHLFYGFAGIFGAAWDPDSAFLTFKAPQKSENYSSVFYQQS